MKTKSSILAVAICLPLIGGCVKETVDKGPPKFGQTVERPHTEQTVVAEERANQVQQDTAQPRVIVPNENTSANNATPASSTAAPMSPSNNNSIFTNNATPVTNNNISAPPSNGDTRGGVNSANTNYGNNGHVQIVPEPGIISQPPANGPQGSALSPAPTPAPIRDGG